MKAKLTFSLGLSLILNAVIGQVVKLRGEITDGIEPLAGVQIILNDGEKYMTSDKRGHFSLSLNRDISDKIKITFKKAGFADETMYLSVPQADSSLTVLLTREGGILDEVVISAALTPMRKTETAVPVEVIQKGLTDRISTPQIMDLFPALPGVRVQYSCNVCQAPGLQLNGLPGPYTTLMIDGMPLMGPLSSTYGLFSLPTFLMHQVEVSRGPSSVLFGSEAIGGIVNILTPNPDVLPALQIEKELTTLGESTLQLMASHRKNNWRMLTGGYLYYFDNRIDRNEDNFMDIPLQKRFSLFNKLTYGDIWDVYLRYYYEDRLGGQMQGTHADRHSRRSYVESIFTNRLEWIMKYNPKHLKPLSVWWSSSAHDQNSIYGEDLFLARQYISQLQLLWQTGGKDFSYTVGSAARFQYYNDNTTATKLYEEDQPTEAPEVFLMPGVFMDYHYRINNLKVNTGIRFDHHPVHRMIPTYRVGFFYSRDGHHVRLHHGTAFRVVNLFAEEHAALSGAREVVIRSELRPEQSIGTQLEWEFIKLKTNYSVRFTANGFYNVFSNRILPDYDTDPNKIIFDNLEDSFSQAGINARGEISLNGRWEFSFGGSLQRVRIKEEDGSYSIPPFVEQYSVQTLAGYNGGRWRADVSSFTYGPMRLPLAGNLDPRPEYSPVFTHLNAQIAIELNMRSKLILGVRNLLDFLPWRGLPFIIARADDPFDSKVEFDSQGEPLQTPDNPYALTFDPEYAYTSLQGRRFFIQWRYSF